MSTTAAADPRRAAAFLVAAILVEVTGSLTLKAALADARLYVLAALAYVVAFVCLARVLRAGFAVGVAYAVWGVAGVVLTALLSWFVYDERLGVIATLGVLLIIGGIVCIETGSRADTEGRA